MLQFIYQIHVCLKVQHSETLQINTFDFKEKESSEIKGRIDTLKLKPKHREPFYWKSTAAVLKYTDPNELLNLKCYWAPKSLKPCHYRY